MAIIGMPQKTAAGSFVNFTNRVAETVGGITSRETVSKSLKFATRVGVSAAGFVGGNATIFGRKFLPIMPTALRIGIGYNVFAGTVKLAQAVKDRDSQKAKDAVVHGLCAAIDYTLIANPVTYLAIPVALAVNAFAPGLVKGAMNKLSQAKQRIFGMSAEDKVARELQIQTQIGAAHARFASQQQQRAFLAERDADAAGFEAFHQRQRAEGLEGDVDDLDQAYNAERQRGDAAVAQLQQLQAAPLPAPVVHHVQGRERLVPRERYDLRPVAGGSPGTPGRRGLRRVSMFGGDGR